MSRSGGQPLLVLNLGSATLKAARFDELPSRSRGPGQGRRVELALHDVDSSPEALLAHALEVLGFTAPPGRVGHRIVHGGDAGEARLLDGAEIGRLHALEGMAPLHQVPALALVHAATRAWPGAMQYGVFDTLWHAGLPAVTRRLPVPESWDVLGVKRYGFHGLAFASAMRMLEELDPGTARSRVVLAHLGGGSSVCAVHAGRSLDTTMSMTPLDGLPMATRSGSLDPGALLFLLRRAGMSADNLQQALYHQSGLLGISGVSGHARDLLDSGRSQDRLALDQFALRVAQAIAGMATCLGGVDHLVFSGGVGARAPRIRSAIVKHLGWMGMQLDPVANDRGDSRLALAGSQTGIWRVEVNEEVEIALACASVLHRAGGDGPRPGSSSRLS